MRREGWILDLETVPEDLKAGEAIRLPEAYRLPFVEPKARTLPRNYKAGSEAAQRWHKAEAERLEALQRTALAEHEAACLDAYLRTALHPRKCRIVAWALAPLHGGDVLSASGEEECLLLDELAQFWPVAGSKILAWNGPGFDFRVLWARSLFLGVVSPLMPVCTNGRLYWSSSTMLDLMAFAPEARPRASLRACAAAWGVPVVTAPGSEVAQLFSAGRLEEIEEHCREDVIVSQALAHCFGVPELIGVDCD